MNTSNFVSIPASMFEDQEILVFEDHRLTYGQLWSEIQRLANALLALGVKRGDCVAVLQTNSHRYVQAYYATAAVGGVFLPLNYRAKLQELEYGQSSPPARTFTQVAVGRLHTCGLKTDGTLACWGDNSLGQSTPPAATFTQLAAAGDCTCGVKTDGAFVCWGDNSQGQVDMIFKDGF